MSDQPQPEGLTHPGPPIMLVVTIDADGNGSTRYLCPPEQAIGMLRNIADDIERQVAATEEIL